MYLFCPNRLSYTRARELIKETLSGIDSDVFNTHSLRAGGATFIAKNLPRSEAPTDYLCSTVAGDPNKLRIRALKSL